MLPRIGTLARAVRLPFISVSVLPCVFGSLLALPGFDAVRFVLGLAAVAGTHLSANLLNDYADAKSGADAHDVRYFGLFGGSKLIQEGVLTAGWYRAASIACACGAVAAVLALALMTGDALILALYAAILLLAWSYSARPLQLSYRRLGEAAVFLLFGPACVMGALYIQTGEFPTWRGFLTSLPFGFLTVSVLMANEVPDLADDLRSGKRTLVSVTGGRGGAWLYGGTVACALAAVIVCFLAGHVTLMGLLALASVWPAIMAVREMRAHTDDKRLLLRSSRLAIAAQNIGALGMIAGLFL